MARSKCTSPTEAEVQNTTHVKRRRNEKIFSLVSRATAKRKTDDSKGSTRRLRSDGYQKSQTMMV